MAESATLQLARLQMEIQNLQAQVQARQAVTKDLSLVLLIPKWSRTDNALPVGKFCTTIKGSARVGN
jgi:hypothetical protein